MFTAEFSLLLGIVALIAGGSLVQQVRMLAPQMIELRRELAATPEQREMRYTLRDVIVSYDDSKIVSFDDGKVVALPVRPVRLVRPAQPLRAAA